MVSAADGPDLSETLTIREVFAFEDVEGLPDSWSMVPGGHFVMGEVGGVSAQAWTSPRSDGMPIAESAYGTRVAVELGIKGLVACAPAVPLNPTWQDGDLAVVSDHINVSGQNPLIGANVEAHGVRFPDMSFVYDRELRNTARTAILATGSLPREGTVAAVRTLAGTTANDARLLSELGADALTSGIVPDVLVARHATRAAVALAVVSGPAGQPARSDLGTVMGALADSIEERRR